MRRPTVSLFMLACALSLFVGVSAASADNGPHVANAGLVADTCAACHRAHTAKAPFLLKQSEETLCYTCHGASATGSNLDVEDGVGYAGEGRSGGPAGGLRGGGFKYALIESSNPTSGVVPVRETGVPTTSAHSVDYSSHTAWGNGPISAEANYGATVSLRCGSCHDPHGNGDYRILRPIPKESGATEGVSIPDAATKQYTTTNYWQTGEPNNLQFRYLVAQWCTTCHTRYLAGSKSFETNSGDAVFTYRHRSLYTQEEYEAAEKLGKTRPNCIQCHVAHGSNALMGTWSSTVNYPDGTPGGSDSRLLRVDNRGTCQMCHKK